MSSTITFKIMSNDRDYQIQLAKEFCNWENFMGSFLEQSTKQLETPLYYFDTDNTKQMIMDTSSFSAMLLDSGNSENNIIHLYEDGNNVPGAATGKTTDWVFAPEDETLNDIKRPAQSDNGTSISQRYSTCFLLLGQLIGKHGPLIDSNPHIGILVRRFASTIATTPDAEMMTLLDQWLTSYNNNNNISSNDKSATTSKTTEHGKRHKHRHCGRREKEHGERCGGRRELLASLPDELAQFISANRRGRHHHHQHHPLRDQHHYPPLDFMPFPWRDGMHKHKHHHHHRHYHDEQQQQPHCSFYGATGPFGAFAPSTTGPWGVHPFFGGRRGNFSMMCSRSDRHFEKAMKHHHRHHRHYPYLFDTSSSSSDSTTSSSSSSSSSSSENEDNNNNNVDHKEIGSKRQEKKLWKAMAKEHIRQAHGRRAHGRHNYHGMPGPDPMSFFTGRPPLGGGQVPLPGYVEHSFGQMHLNDSKNQ